MCPLMIYLNGCRHVIMLALFTCNWTYISIYVHVHLNTVTFAHMHEYVHAHDYMHTITLRRMLKCPHSHPYKQTHPCNTLKCTHSCSPHT